jgi:hypothetical protein
VLPYPHGISHTQIIAHRGNGCIALGWGYLFYLILEWSCCYCLLNICKCCCNMSSHPHMIVWTTFV